MWSEIEHGGQGGGGKGDVGQKCEKGGEEVKLGQEVKLGEGGKVKKEEKEV